MAESSIEQTVCNVAENQGWFVRKCQWLGRNGAPDRIFAKDRRVVFIEFKDQGKEPEVHQEREIQRMLDAGLEVHVVDRVYVAYRILGLTPP